MYNINYIAVGTGRCGTGYISKLLTSGGIACGHEKIFTYLGVRNPKSTGSKLVADSSLYAAPFFDHPIIKNATIIHVMRNPINILNSYLRLNIVAKIRSGDLGGARNFMQHHEPALLGASNIVDAIALWIINWTKKIEKAPQHRVIFNVEKPSNELYNLIQVKVPNNRVLFKDRHYNNKKHKKHAYPPMTINDISLQYRRQFHDLCSQYGY